MMRVVCKGVRSISIYVEKKYKRIEKMSYIESGM